MAEDALEALERAIASTSASPSSAPATSPTTIRTIDSQLEGLDAILSSLIDEKSPVKSNARDQHEDKKAAARRAASQEDAIQKRRAQQEALARKRLREAQLRAQQLREAKAKQEGVLAKKAQEDARAYAQKLLQQRREEAKAREIERMRMELMKAAEEERMLEERRMAEASKRLASGGSTATTTRAFSSSTTERSEKAVDPYTPPHKEDGDGVGDDDDVAEVELSDAQRRQREQQLRDEKYRAELREKKEREKEQSALEAQQRRKADAKRRAFGTLGRKTENLRSGYTSPKSGGGAPQTSSSPIVKTSTSLPDGTTAQHRPASSHPTYSPSIPSSASVPLHSIVDRAEEQRRRDREFAQNIAMIKKEIGMASDTTHPRWFALACTVASCKSKDVTFNLSRGYCVCEECDNDALNPPLGRLYATHWIPKRGEWASKEAQVLSGSLVDKGTSLMRMLTHIIPSMSMIVSPVCNQCGHIDATINLLRGFFKCENCGSEDNSRKRGTSIDGNSGVVPSNTLAQSLPSPKKASSPTKKSLPEDAAVGHESFVHRTPEELFSAARSGNVDVIREVLDCGINVNAKDDAGYTALHWASAMLHYTAVSVLVERGADVNVVNGKGFTPLHLAQGRGDEKLSKWLIKHGAVKSRKPAGDAVQPTGGGSARKSSLSTLSRKGSRKLSRKSSRTPMGTTAVVRTPPKNYESRIMRIWAGGGYKKMTLSNQMTSSELVEKFAEKFGALTLVKDLAVYEERKGKRRVCSDDEFPWERMMKWPREYVVDEVEDFKEEKYKFVISVRKGADKASKEKWKLIAV